jgi:phosphotransferase system  glucose/maltose/N-acetylglucosamine-specific IIC component
MSTAHSVTRKPLPVHTTGPAAPEWEAAEEGEIKKSRFGIGAIGGSATGWAISRRFDRVLPPHKRYFGRSRRVLLIAIGVIFLLLLALIIGLAVGLSKKSKYISPPSALPSITNNSQGQDASFTRWRENIHR